MKKVYIAGPLFNQGDRWFLEKIDELLQSYDFVTYLPHRDGGLCPSDGRDTKSFFQSDIHALDSCDIIVSVLHGTDVDSGTAWEMGYGYAQKKPILAIAEDIRIANEITNVNLMMSNSSKIFFTYESFFEYIEQFCNEK